MNRVSWVCCFMVFSFSSLAAQDTLRVLYYPSGKQIAETVLSSVTQDGMSYRYEYEVRNAGNADQSVWIVLVLTNAQIDSFNSPPGWDGSITRGVQDVLRVQWAGIDTMNFIRPDSSLRGFWIVSQSLPSVTTYYAEGWFELPRLTIEPDSIVGDGDIFDTSKSGVTISPRTPPTPFNGLGFLDTIKSYINQSRTLNWITTQAAANKYTALIDSAQSHLAATPTRRGAAKAKLDSVLLNVYPDSSAGLITSEAYALLRFNTEYVLKKLREEDSTFAAGNKSSSWDATATNNARHLAKSESYLHEVFTSGGEVFYRRSEDGGSSWDQTHRINTAVGDNSRPCITVSQHGTAQIVWQRKIAPSTYEVWHSYSQDNGESWSTPAVLPEADAVGVSNYQTDGTTPVIAEVKESGQLVVVYCSQGGLLHQLSEDDGASWADPVSISGQYDDRVRYPTLAGSESFVSLVYDYANDTESPWSRMYNGSEWSEEESVGKGTDISDAEYSSVAIDGNGDPIAAWTGVSINMTYGKVITFRAGYSENSWSDWFTMFGQNFVDRLSPSVTYYNSEEGYGGVAIVNHTLQDHIKLITLRSADPPSWDVSTINESGAWANITQETSTSGTPIYCWTDQSEFPYEVVVARQTEVGLGSSSGLASSKGKVVKPTEGVGQSTILRVDRRVGKRRAVVHHRTLRSTLALEFEPMKIVLANGDTTVVPFKNSSLRQRGKIKYTNMWDYLGSGIVNIPANARQLIVSKQFGQRGATIWDKKFSLHVLNASGISIAVLDTTSTSGTVSVNIAPYAGMNVTFRPRLVVSGIESAHVDVGVGDVYIK
ncbi:MAG TPA: sialidase family protein [Bacteroidota bacterium]